MNARSPIGLLAVLAAATFASAPVRAGQAIYACPRADGSVELVSQRNSAQCELIAGAEAAASAPVATAAVAVTAAAPSDAASAVPPLAAAAAPKPAAESRPDANAVQEDPRKLYRDAMLQRAQGGDGAPAAAVNRALGRRYQATDRTGYLKAQGDGA